MEDGKNPDAFPFSALLLPVLFLQTVLKTRGYIPANVQKGVVDLNSPLEYLHSIGVEGMRIQIRSLVQQTDWEMVVALRGRMMLKPLLGLPKYVQGTASGNQIKTIMIVVIILQKRWSSAR